MKLLLYGTIAAFVITNVGIFLWALLNIWRRGRGGVK
jgi:hypothetical protein